MSEPETPPQRRRWIALGELIALAALIISALGLWNSWRRSDEEKSGPTEVVERKTAIPLVLRGRIADDGKRVEIAPVEGGHALESLTVTAPGSSPIIVDSDGVLSADELEPAAKALDPKREGDGRLRVTISARYVENGADRTAKHSYTIGYRWDGGGLFGGKSLRLTSFSRT